MQQKNYHLKNFTSLIDNINVNYYRELLPKATADRYFNTFERKLKYNTAEESKVKVHGNEWYIQRKQVAYGAPGTFYRFAGTKVNAISWEIKSSDNKPTDPILHIIHKIRKKVELFTGQKYNFVLINRYADGEDYISHHFDATADLVENSSIVGVTLGAERDFSLKAINFIPKRLQPRIDFILHHGSIYEMRHPTNEHWKHGVPKRADVKTPRVSLTFRQMKVVIKE